MPAASPFGRAGRRCAAAVEEAGDWWPESDPQAEWLETYERLAAEDAASDLALDCDPEFDPEDL